jgi:fructokinase
MILCCGEALIDMLPRETAAGEPAFAPHAGGAVFNTAIALGRLGADTGFFSGLSDDLFGEILADTLTASGVDAAPAHRSSRPTTLAFVKLVDGQATYAFYDENTAGRMLSVDDLPILTDDVQALFFGGISLVPDPCGHAYETLALRAARDRAVMIDPNIRPGFITDEPAYRARIARMMAAADIVKLSDDDLHWLAGPGDMADLARGLLDTGPRLVCITEGAKGATGYTSRGQVSVAARRVSVVDTVGAGDTFNAGVLAALDDAGALNKSALAELPDAVVEQALQLGVQAAAITVSRAGANPPTRAEL